MLLFLLIIMSIIVMPYYAGNDSSGHSLISHFNEQQLNFSMLQKHCALFSIFQVTYISQASS